MDIRQLFGRTDPLSPQERKAAIEAGIMSPEDFAPRPQVVPAPIPQYRGGSSAPADQRAITGETELQQRQRQQQQLQELLNARKRQGYAVGGLVQCSQGTDNASLLRLLSTLLNRNT